MSDTISTRLKNAWNAFFNKDPTRSFFNGGTGNYTRPDRIKLTRGNERSLITSIYNRIALDVASKDIEHVQLDDDGRFSDVIKSRLNECLTLSANLDQTGRALIQDCVLSMLDEGCVALVPVDTDIDPMVSGSYDIYSIRTGKIIEWYPRNVKVEAYNEKTGKKEQIILPKESTAIIENPFYSVMNAPNSTLQRLVRKLVLLDIVDENNNSGKLDLIIQLPYTIKSEARRKQAEQRRRLIEEQLSGTKYGIAYTDGTERVTQLNRAVENNLLAQIEMLKGDLYSQLGLTQEIMNGTADEKTMLNYENRTIEPILSAITDEMKRKFLTPTARTIGQSIEFFRDPFRLVPVSDISEIADKFTRNEIMTSNEIRQVIGMKPSDDPEADVLRNKNLSEPKTNETVNEVIKEPEEENQNAKV